MPEFPPGSDFGDGPGLPDAAIVIRGGVMTLSLLRAAVERSHREDGTYDISVWASAELDAEGIARQVRELDPRCEHLPHRRMQVADVGAIREVAEDVVLTEPPDGHHSIRFRTSPADNELEALMGVFGDPRENPVARRT